MRSESATLDAGAAIGAKVKVTVSPHDASWDRVPLAKLDELAAAVLRAATRVGHYQPNQSENPKLPVRKPGKVVKLLPWRAVS